MTARGYAAQAARNPARERLIAEHIDMARRIALRVARRTPEWMTGDDLVAAAMVGLTEAADRFDPTRGEPFVAFAEKRVRGAVFDELRRGDLLSRRARAAARRVESATAALRGKLGRPPEDEEIAEELGVSVDEYRDDLAALSNVAIVELGPQAEATRDQTDDPASSLERRELVALLRRGLGELQPRDAQLLNLYYVEELSYSEIGEVLGVSESRVCQLHGRAIARLRAAIGATQEEVD